MRVGELRRRRLMPGWRLVMMVRLLLLLLLLLLLISHSSRGVATGRSERHRLGHVRLMIG
jgi:hypothetical protein